MRIAPVIPNNCRLPRRQHADDSARNLLRRMGGQLDALEQTRSIEELFLVIVNFVKTFIIANVDGNIAYKIHFVSNFIFKISAKALFSKAAANFFTNSSKENPFSA